MSVLNTLKAVWGVSKGYVFIPHKTKDNKWIEGKAYEYPEEWGTIQADIESFAKNKCDTYWCPFVFSKPKRLKEYAQDKINILWADLDEADPHTFEELKPSIAWKSSSSRYQAIWLLSEESNKDNVEIVNKALTLKLGADKGGWDITQVLRVPGTPNYKYDPPQKGMLLWAEKRIFSLDKIKELVTDTEPTEEETIDHLLEGWVVPERILDLLHTPESATEVGERSDRLWEIETSLVEAGMPIMDIVEVISKCGYNKFKDRRDGGSQIFKEVTKAEAHVKERLKKTKEITLDPKAESLKDELWAIPYDRFVGKELTPPRWIIEGMWQDETSGMIAGEPKTYKSVISSDMALSICSGRPFADTAMVMKRGTVLYIQEENGESTVQDRVNKITFQKGCSTLADGYVIPDDIPIFFSNNYGVDITAEDSRKLVEETLIHLKPILVILDPLYMMLGNKDENSASDVRDTLRWLSYLRNQYHCGILICHHYNKGGTNQRAGQRVRGTSQFHAWVENGIYVQKPAEPNIVNIEREYRAFTTTDKISMQVKLGVPGELQYNVSLEPYGEKSEKIEEKEGAEREMVFDIVTKYDSVSASEICEFTSLSSYKVTKYLKDLRTSHRIGQFKTMKGFVYKVMEVDEED